MNVGFFDLPLLMQFVAQLSRTVAAGFMDPLFYGVPVRLSPTTRSAPTLSFPQPTQPPLLPAMNGFSYGLGGPIEMLCNLLHLPASGIEPQGTSSLLDPLGDTISVTEFP